MIKALSKALSNSKSHTTPIKLVDETNKIKQLIISNFKNSFNFSEKEVSKLTRKDLNEISELVSNKKKKEIVDILYPIIKSQISKDYLKLEKKDIRPSLQCKYVWEEEDENYSRKTFYKENRMYESRLRENFCYPTRPHQDFENNGFRSLNTLIFYFQLTKVSKKSCDLKVANFIKRTSLLETKNAWNYQNQFSEKCNDTLNWMTPKKLNKDHMLVMDALTPHSSDLISKIPRLAINVKLHPTQNDFLFESDFLKHFRKRKISNQSRLKILENYFNDNINNQPGLNLELAILEYFYGKFDKSIEYIQRFCDFKISKKETYKILAGMILKKNLFQIIPRDIENLKNNKIVVNNFSFAKRSLEFLKY